MSVSKKIIWMDSLRGLACIIVLFAHILSTDEDLTSYLSGCGKIGVWCFMVLAGFFAMNSCLNKNTGNNAVGKEIEKYYIKKITRIYPSYILVLAFAYGTGWITSIKDILMHLFGLSGFGHLWYMPVILQFYLIFPIFIFLHKYIKEKLFVGLLFIVILISQIVFPYTNYIENSICLYWYIPVFIMGMLLAIIMKKDDSGMKYKATDVLIVISLLIIISMTPYFRKIILGIEPSNWLQNKYMFLGLIWSMIIWALQYSKVFKMLLNKVKFLQFIGYISFELYLIHFIVLFIWGIKIQNMVLRFVFTFSISFVLSLLIKFGTEKVLKKLKKLKIYEVHHG